MVFRHAIVLAAVLASGCAHRPTFRDLAQMYRGSPDAWSFVVVERGSGRPVPGARIELQATGVHLSTTTSPEGVFTLPADQRIFDENPVVEVLLPVGVKSYDIIDARPEVASEVKVAYPREAVEAGVGGSVHLRVTIDAEGKVVSAEVLDGPGHGLNEAAQQGLRQFRFRAPASGCSPARCTFTYVYTFIGGG